MSDETRLEFLERGRMASQVLQEAKQALQSAHAVYSAIIKDAKKAGASEIAWTLKQLRRDPLEIRAEIIERNRMLKLAKIDVGTQLGLFDEPETMSEAMLRAAGQAHLQALQALETRDKMVDRIEAAMEQVEETLFKPADAADVADETLGELLSHPPDPSDTDPRPIRTDMSRDPPKPGPDDEPEDEEVPAEQEPDEDEEPVEVQGARAGNEVLERTPEDKNAFIMGQRSRMLERTLDANPFKDVSTTHGAWIRGWKTQDAIKKAQAPR